MNELQIILKNVQIELGFSINFDSRKRPHVYARSVYFKAAKVLTNLGLEDIGKEVGKKSHATVIHGINLFDDVIYKYEQQYVECYYKVVSIGKKVPITVKNVDLLTFGIRC